MGLEYYDRDRPEGFAQLLQGLVAAMKNNERSLLIHVEGTRRRSALPPR